MTTTQHHLELSMLSARPGNSPSKFCVNTPTSHPRNTRHHSSSNIGSIWVMGIDETYPEGCTISTSSATTSWISFSVGRDQTSFHFLVTFSDSSFFLFVKTALILDELKHSDGRSTEAYLISVCFTRRSMSLHRLLLQGLQFDDECVSHKNCH